MADVDMKDPPATATAKKPVAEEKAASVAPRYITVGDIVKNAELIVKAVESNQTRLTTRAISRYCHTTTTTVETLELYSLCTILWQRANACATNCYRCVRSARSVGC